jgi:hypothetical protein
MQTMWEEFLRLLQTDHVFRAEVRRLVLTEELLMLPEKVEELTRAVRELIETQRQHSEILRQPASGLPPSLLPAQHRICQLAGKLQRQQFARPSTKSGPQAKGRLRAL